MFMPKKVDQMSLEQKVQLLLDEREIRNVQTRWCRAVDRADLDLMKSCFYEDGVDHHAPFFESTFGAMAETFVQSLEKLATNSMYTLGNLSIEIDGNVARTESYLCSQLILPERAESGNKVMAFTGLRYLDRFEKRHGEWRIAERWFVQEWRLFPEVPEPTKMMGSIPPPAEWTLKPIVSHKDGRDISYSI